MIDVSRIQNGDSVLARVSRRPGESRTRRARVCSWRAGVPMLGARDVVVRRDLVTVRVDDTQEYLVLSAADLYPDTIS